MTRLPFSDCSHDKIVRAARKLGLLIFEGKKHTKIKDHRNQLITLVPRHRRLKRELVLGIVRAFIKLGIDEQTVRRAIRC